jgi:protein ImuB
VRALVVRCPDWQETETFEPVVAAVEEHATGVEILRPGLLVLAARGPASYYGGEEAAAERLVDAVAESCGVDCAVGIADSLFAAYLAAHRGVIVPPGQTPQFLADVDIAALGRPDLTSVLRRLGICTLGAFAALPQTAVADRFGADAGFAHRLADGADTRPPAPRTPPPDLTVSIDCDPPLDRVDVAAFTARALAVQLHRLLDAHGLACSRLVIEAVTGQGAVISRTWRHDGALSAEGVTDRVRWQLDGWLTTTTTPGSGIAALSLTPDGLMTASDAQPGLWGDTGSGELRAGRALVHVQGLLGGEGVLTAVPSGGRGWSERIRLIPWGEPREPLRPPQRPWPGALLSPVPSKGSVEPVTARVCDAAGEPVSVDGRCLLTAAPATVECGGREPVTVVAWAGPWPVVEHWWRPDSRRYARLQVCLSDDRAFLLSIEDGQWSVEGHYDLLPGRGAPWITRSCTAILTSVSATAPTRHDGWSQKPLDWDCRGWPSPTMTATTVSPSSPKPLVSLACPPSSGLSSVCTCHSRSAAGPTRPAPIWWSWRATRSAIGGCPVPSRRPS